MVTHECVSTTTPSKARGRHDGCADAERCAMTCLILDDFLLQGILYAYYISKQVVLIVARVRIRVVRVPVALTWL